MDVGDDALTSFQVRSETGEWFVSVEAKISPNLRDPKKAVVAAHQMTCFARGSQSVRAIRDPSVIRSGKVTTRLVLLTGDDNDILLAPFRRRAIVKSEVMWSAEKPRKLWTNFNAEIYDFMVECESPRHCEHHIINARQTVGAIGQGKLFLESASKQAKVFMAEEYLAQVDFAIAVFTMLW
jgi:hypothetical protein